MEYTPPYMHSFFLDFYKNDSATKIDYSNFAKKYKMRLDGIFVCDVFKNGNYWQMYMTQEEIDLARSSGFMVIIDSKEPEIFKTFVEDFMVIIDSKEPEIFKTFVEEVDKYYSNEFTKECLGEWN